MPIMVDVFITLALFLLFVGWLWAEARGGKALRIALGLACMLALSGGIYVVIENYGEQSIWHRACFRRINQLLGEGKQPRVKRALEEYERQREAGVDSRQAATRALNILNGSDE